MLADRFIMEEMLFTPARDTARQLDRRSVNVYSDMRDTVYEGEVVTLTGELIGFDPSEVTLQWQYDDGFFWTDVPEANSMSYSFIATPETVNYSWRLSVIEHN